jgi:uncharacterized protein YegJ (DUF2314 family)
MKIYITSSIIILITFITFLIGCGSKDSPPNARVVPIPDEDQEINAAMDKARSSLNEFIERFNHPHASDKWFLVKGRFTHGDRIEHIWVADLVFDGKVFSGVLANEPEIPGLKFKQHVSISLDNVSDWMYVSDGRPIGGFTTRVLYGRMSPEERKRDDAERPYRIDEPS